MKQTILELHHAAMDFARQAFEARFRGEHELAKSLFRESYTLERDAASRYFKRLTAEPDRSVLYRSAASLALNAGEYRESERLAAIGLSGYPPNEIAQELRELFEQVSA